VYEDIYGFGCNPANAMDALDELHRIAGVGIEPGTNVLEFNLIYGDARGDGTGVYEDVAFLCNGIDVLHVGPLVVYVEESVLINLGLVAVVPLDLDFLVLFAQSCLKTF
jgi:hypothetical protein